MKILGLDTSSNVASVALVEDDKLVCEYTLNFKLTHSQTLMPMIEEICKACELDLKTIDAVAVANGPGSFTGLRIGLATAKGLAHGVDKSVVPVSTLDGLAYNIVYSDKLIVPIMDARRNQVYTALYLWENNQLVRKSEYMAIPIQELLDKVNEYKKEVIFLGDGVPVYKVVIKEQLQESKYIFAPSNCNMQRAANIASLGMKYFKEGKVKSYMECVPFYLRKSQAEREREEKRKMRDEK